MTAHPGTHDRIEALFPSVSRARGVPAHPGTPPAAPTPAHMRDREAGAGGRGVPDEVSDLDLIEVLDALDATGVSFDLDRSEPTPVLVFEPPLTPEAEALIAPVLGWLAYVAVGRYTGHGPARCDRCGWVTMLATDDRRGERSRCRDPRCGGRRVIRDADLFAIRRTRRGQGARAAARSRARDRAADALDDALDDDDATPS